MKKILMTALIAITFSCNNATTEFEDHQNVGGVNYTEQTTTTNETVSPSIDDDIDEMFSDYISSQEYIEVNVAVSEFNTGLNNSSVMSTFANEESMFNWIGTNLSITNFNNLAEAQTSWNNVKMSTTSLNNSFPEMWDYISSAQLLDVEYRFDKWFGYTNGTNDASAYCQNQLKACRKNASDAYANGAVALSRSFMADEMTTIQKDYDLRKLKADFDNAMDLCIKNFNNCN